MDITKRLEIKSNMIFMGEKIAFGSECELMDEAIIEIQTLRAKVASAEVFNLEQILHDPENQPSQYGTVPLEWYENLENKINRIRFNVEQVIDSLSGSYDMHAIRKKLQIAVDEEALATYDKQSEVKHETKR